MVLQNDAQRREASNRVLEIIEALKGWAQGHFFAKSIKYDTPCERLAC